MRLTKRDEFGNADIVGVNSADLQLNLEFDEFNKVTSALNKLAHYEELQEQGRLIELPCAVGTMVYCIHQTPTKPVITCTNADEFMLVLCTIEGRFGKTVFLTKEEAKAALKEREQE